MPSGPVDLSYCGTALTTRMHSQQNRNSILQ
jgi:hypothetical protein